MSRKLPLSTPAERMAGRATGMARDSNPAELSFLPDEIRRDIVDVLYKAPEAVRKGWQDLEDLADT